MSRPSACRWLPLGSPQHSDDHGSRQTVLFEVDQELAERPRCRARSELADPRRTVKSPAASRRGVLGSNGRREGVEPVAKQLLELRTTPVATR